MNTKKTWCIQKYTVGGVLASILVLLALLGSCEKPFVTDPNDVILITLKAGPNITLNRPSMFEALKGSPWTSIKKRAASMTRVGAGYVIGAWKLDNASGAEISDSTPFTADTVIYVEAGEAITVTVTADGNSEVSAPGTFSALKGESFMRMRARALSLITLKQPEAYALKEWRINDAAGAIIQDSDTFAADTTIYAIASEFITLTITGSSGVSVASPAVLRAGRGARWQDILISAQTMLSFAPSVKGLIWKFTNESGNPIPRDHIFDVNTEIYAYGTSVEPPVMVPIAAVSNAVLGNDSEGFNKRHTVELSAYEIGETEVTNGLWCAVMGGSTNAPNHPKEMVTWARASAFCNELTKKTFGNAYCVYYSDSGLTSMYTTSDAANNRNIYADWTKKGYRLPTEAEWEYAAMGGVPGITYAGTNSTSNVYEYAWFSVDPDNNPIMSVNEVRTKKPNGYGLYDMSGNAYEIVWDWHTDTPLTGHLVNPRGGPPSLDRVHKGGHIRFGPRPLVKHDYHLWTHDDNDWWQGFRLARYP